MKEHKLWSSLEEESVMAYWPNADKVSLLHALPGRSYEQIKDKARHLGVRAEGQPRKRTTDLSYLDELTMETAY